MQNAPEVVFPNLGIEIAHISRVAFTVFGVPVYFYGVFIVLGVIIGMALGIREAKRTGQNPEDYMDLLFYVLILAIIVSRLFYVAFRWDNYKNDLLSILNFREGGLSIYGVVIGGFIAAFLYTRKKKLNFLQITDTLVPSLILGQALGRWGNFFNREVFGFYTDNLFAMRYLVDQVYDIPASVAEHIVNVNGASYIQVHPTFLYESAWNLLLFFFLFYWQRKKKRHGEVSLLYFAGYGFARFFIEGIRTDRLYLWGTNIAVAQILAVISVVGGLFAFIWLRRNPQN